MASSTVHQRGRTAVPQYIPTRRSGGDRPTITPDMILERVLDFLRRRGLVAVSVALLAGILTGIVAWMNIPLVYTARRDINLSPPEQHQLAEFKQTQIEKLISPAVCKVAVNLPEARELGFVRASADPGEALSRWIEIASDPLAQSFSVMISDADPKVAQTLVNCTVEGYLQHAQEEKTREIAHDVKLAEALLEENVRGIQRIKDQQAEKARQAGYGDPQSLRKKVEELDRTIRELEDDLDKIDLQRIESERSLESRMGDSDEPTPDQELALQTAQQGNADMNRALAQLEAQAAQIAENSVHGENDPDYIRYQRFIEETKASLGGGKDQLRQKYTEANRARRLDDVRKLEGVIAGLSQQETAIRERIRGTRDLMSNLQEVVLDIERTRLDLESRERAVEDANNQLNNLKQSAKQTLVSSPTPADEPKLPKSSSKRLVAIFGGAVAAMLGVLSLFAYSDFQVNLISRPEHLEKTQPLPVLGVLPRLPEGKRIPTDDDYLPKSKHRSVWFAMNEAINSLRVTLTFAPDRHNDGMSALMVTSPRDAEGKSTFSAHLAICLARTGVKVILVEADMHRPTQFETFGVERSPGLSDVLQGNAEVRDVIRETDYPSLYILPAGTPIDERTPTLLPDRVQSVFAELRTMCETIIIDAPPVLPVYDSLVFGQNVDQTILLLRCDHSRFQTIGQARNRLESVGISVAGLVVCSSDSAGRYGYYYDSYAGGGGKYHAGQNGKSPSPAAESNGHQAKDQLSKSQVES